MSDQITALPTSLPEGLEWPSQPCDCEAFALCPGGCRPTLARRNMSRRERSVRRIAIVQFASLADVVSPDFKF